MPTFPAPSALAQSARTSEIVTPSGVVPAEGREAFSAMLDLLDAHHVAASITGGLAARWYGSSRRLQDIDFEIPDIRVAPLARAACELGAAMTLAPGRFVDEERDMVRAVVTWHGFRVDLIGNTSARVRHTEAGRWAPLPVSCRHTRRTCWEGRPVTLVGRDELEAYKRLLNRTADRLDLAAIAQPHR